MILFCGSLAVGLSDLYIVGKSFFFIGAGDLIS